MSGDGTSERDRKISDLQGFLASSQYRVDLLQKEITFYRTQTALMREALLTARSAIEKLQQQARNERKHFKITGRVLSAKIPIEKIRNLATFRSRGSNPVSRAVLERLLLRAARAKMRGIEGVVVEYHAGPSTNWRVCGIASGKIDADLAKAAVSEAAANLATYVLIADSDNKPARQPKRVSRLVGRRHWMR